METYALLSIIHFADGGDVEWMLLHAGTERECERAAHQMPAVAYSGPRPLDRAELRWGPVTDEQLKQMRGGPVQ